MEYDSAKYFVEKKLFQSKIIYEEKWYAKLE